MPRPKENAPAPAQFNVKELQIGRRKWRSGTSGPAVQIAGDPLLGTPPQKVPRNETFLCGKIMLGNKRFAFEVLEINRSPENVAKILRKQRIARGDREDFAPTFWNVSLARLHSPLYSFQLKFEDVLSMESHALYDEVELVFTLKKALSCYMKTNGGSLQTVESPVGNAKTIRCVTAPPLSEQDLLAWHCGSQVHFRQARELAVGHSPVLAALFSGRPVPKDVVVPVKRKANKDTPGNVSKRLKKEAQGAKTLSETENKLLDVEVVKKSLNDYVSSLAHTVDMDWHDSYEETDEMIVEWFSECGVHVKSAIRAATDIGAGFGNAHEILKCVHDTWLNINAIPFRGCPRETLSDADGVEVNLLGDGASEDEDTSVRSIEDLLQIAWPLLLARAASDAKVLDPILMQMLKDAHDNGVIHPQEAHPSEGQLLAQQGKSVVKAVLTGRRRLTDLAAKNDWKSCPCTVKKHRMRRCIDRRFDGPKHLRTRDFGSDSDDSFGGGFGGIFGF